MSTAKEEAFQLLERLPDDVSLETILYRLLVKAKIERGLAEIEAGQTVPHEQVMEDLEQWLRSIGQ